MYKFSYIMKKYAYILLTSLIIFQTAVVVLSGHNIRYSLGPSSSKIIMNSIETSSAAVNPTMRQTLSRLYRSLNSLLNANQSFYTLKRDMFDYSSFRPLPNILDKGSITAEREHLFLPVLDLVLLI
ncbi:hypothetical protein EOM86_11855 [Candidatus Nomurabacteria bacterium]|nr:hypothetical protein [Candidatus Nomurabacteria bacterium]